MKKISVLYGIGIAILFTLATPIVLTMLQFIFAYNVTRIFTALGVIAYAAAIIPRSERSSGRVFSFIAVCAAMGFVCLTVQGFGRFLLCAAAILWAVRALLLGRGFMHIAADGAIVAAALFFGIFAGEITHSITFCVWTFLLVLAASPVVGAFCAAGKAGPVEEQSSGPAGRFERAYRNAEHALAALARNGN